MIVCMKAGRVFGIHCWICVWTANTEYIYWGSLWGQTSCSV